MKIVYYKFFFYFICWYLALIKVSILAQIYDIDGKKSLDQRIKRPPHIVVIVTDDLGWNDISLHGGSQPTTPNIDQLVKESVELKNYYTMSSCSPSRAALLTGRHAIHTGAYQAFTDPKMHLKKEFSLLPSYLKNCCNYSSHMIGKWHLGFNSLSVLPPDRGFDTFMGFWSTQEDYINHDAMNSIQGISLNAYDFSDNDKVDLRHNGTHSTYSFTQRAIEIMQQTSDQNVNDDEYKPMFLYIAYQSVHMPLQVPDEYIERFKDLNTTTERYQILGMGAMLDDAIGNLTKSLKELGLWDDTILVFTNDNGAPTFPINCPSSNTPLRGGKPTLFEGAVRTIASIRGPGIERTGIAVEAKVHVTDWLPTLVSQVAGQSWRNFMPKGEEPFRLGDGMDVWSSFNPHLHPRTNSDDPPYRDWILLETHPTYTIDRLHGDSLIVGDMKIVKLNDSSPYNEHGWEVPVGEDIYTTPYTLKCGTPPAHFRSHPTIFTCHDSFCLFNITADPCEYHELSNQIGMDVVIRELTKKLAVFQTSAVDNYDGQGCNPVVAALPSGAMVWKPCDWNSDVNFVTSSLT